MQLKEGSDSFVLLEEMKKKYYLILFTLFTVQHSPTCQKAQRIPRGCG